MIPNGGKKTFRIFLNLGNLLWTSKDIKSLKFILGIEDPQEGFKGITIPSKTLQGSCKKFLDLLKVLHTQK